MSQRYFRSTALSLAVMLALAGCSLAPRYERPAAPVPAQYPDLPSQDAAKAAGGVATADLGWREFFRDPRLLALIDLSLKNNRDMRIAVERVQEARAQFGIQQSDRLPTIGLGANGQVQHNPENMRSS
ncbi:MAG TPA: TolC family protein, partial [Eoetvoesiella sp.]|uniref:TolC family protein n=1 Tax=Eoetvoesiella sp. TaxID=1966355 RepID=UPI002C88788A